MNLHDFFFKRRYFSRISAKNAPILLEFGPFSTRDDHFSENSASQLAR
jgi:hypothetical protein